MAVPASVPRTFRGRLKKAIRIAVLFEAAQQTNPTPHTSQKKTRNAVITDYTILWGRCPRVPAGVRAVGDLREGVRREAVRDLAQHPALDALALLAQVARRLHLLREG